MMKEENDEKSFREFIPLLFSSCLDALSSVKMFANTLETLHAFFPPFSCSSYGESEEETMS